MRLKLYERAIYGLLCGRIEALLPVCKTYSDYLWAYTSCYIEQEIHSILLYETAYFHVYLREMFFRFLVQHISRILKKLLLVLTC